MDEALDDVAEEDLRDTVVDKTKHCKICGEELAPNFYYFTEEFPYSEIVTCTSRSIRVI